jgi:putative NADH-flavin reductase
MKLTVFGPTGGTGLQILRQGVAAGHEITVLARTPGKLGELRDAVTIVEGDVRDAAAVTSALEGAEVAISSLGPGSPGRTTIYSDSIRIIIPAMGKVGTQRIICVGAAGMQPGTSRNMPVVGRLVARLVLKAVLDDMWLMQQALAASNLDWTVMWPPMLTNGPLTGQYRTAVGEAIKRGARISRADLADFVLRCIEDKSTSGHAVAIAY